MCNRDLFRETGRQHSLTALVGAIALAVCCGHHVVNDIGDDLAVFGRQSAILLIASF